MTDKVNLAAGESVVARIGLVSDTHAPQRCPEVPEAVFTALQGTDLILHAGDVGDLSVLSRLAEVAPVVAVHGNDETHDAPQVLPEKALVHVAGRRILVVHSHRLGAEADARADRPDDWPTILADRRRLAVEAGADIVVFGHLHVPMAVESEGVLLVNPGIVGHSHVVLRSTVRSVAVMLLAEKDVHVAHVDVETGRIFEPDVDWEGGYWATMERINESIVDPALGDWRTFWRTLRDVEQNLTWTTLLACATECWTGRAERITSDAVLTQLRSDGRADATLLANFERALDALRTR